MTSLVTTISVRTVLRQVIRQISESHADMTSYAWKLNRRLWDDPILNALDGWVDALASFTMLLDVSSQRSDLDGERLLAALANRFQAIVTDVTASLNDTDLTTLRAKRIFGHLFGLDMLRIFFMHEIVAAGLSRENGYTIVHEDEVKSYIDFAIKSGKFLE